MSGAANHNPGSPGHERQHGDDPESAESSGQGAASAFERMKSQDERRLKQNPQGGSPNTGWQQDGR